MSQLAQEKQVNLRTSARLNALSQYVLRISFSAPSNAQCRINLHQTVEESSAKYFVPGLSSTASFQAGTDCTEKKRGTF